MSLTADAIQRIEQLAIAAHNNTLTSLAPGESCDTSLTQPYAILPQGTKVESLEYLRDAPVRMRNTMITERTLDFCLYVAAHATDDTAVFVKPDGGGATAIIDYGRKDAPAWGQHKAILKLQHTPEFAALTKVCAAAQNQQTLIEWLEDWRHTVAPYHLDADGDEVDDSLPLAIAAIRKVTLKATGSNTTSHENMSASRSSFAQVEASSETGRLPAGFHVAARVYPGTDERSISVRLALLTTQEKPTFTLRITGLDTLLQEVAEEVELDISGTLNGKAGAGIYVGAVA